MEWPSWMCHVVSSSSLVPCYNEGHWKAEFMMHKLSGASTLLKSNFPFGRIKNLNNCSPHKVVGWHVLHTWVVCCAVSFFLAIFRQKLIIQVDNPKIPVITLISIARNSSLCFGSEPGSTPLQCQVEPGIPCD
jgi:hypothetical protein